MPKTVLDALSEVSGVPRKEALELFEQVKANHARLDACAGPHDFSVPHRQVGTLVREWACTKCGGHTDSIHKHWYERGLQHARDGGQR